MGGVSSLDLEEGLRAETEKWLERAKVALEGVLPSKDCEDGVRFHANITAYISDCRYFLEKGDLIRAFEAVIWAWAWIEIGLDVGVLVRKVDASEG